MTATARTDGSINLQPDGHPAELTVTDGKVQVGLPMRTALRWATALLAAVAAIGAAGAGAYVAGGSGAAGQMEHRVADLEGRVQDLQPLTKVAADAYAMSQIALEIAVESHRYQIDLILAGIRLDHPDFVPPPTDPRFDRRLRQAEWMLDARDTPAP